MLGNTLLNGLCQKWTEQSSDDVIRYMLITKTWAPCNINTLMPNPAHMSLQYRPANSYSPNPLTKYCAVFLQQHDGWGHSSLSGLLGFWDVLQVSRQHCHGGARPLSGDRGHRRLEKIARGVLRCRSSPRWTLGQSKSKQTHMSN